MEDYRSESKHNSKCLQGVCCDVVNCEYHNENRECCAKQIKVGPGYATSSTETVCDTFKPKSR